MDIFGKLECDGYALLPDVFSRSTCQAIAEDLASTLDEVPDSAGVRRLAGRVLAARNLGRVWPRLQEVAGLVENAIRVESFFAAKPRLVRALYFDKPPGQTWALPWHRDTNVAVEPLDGACVRPSLRAGVPHIQASEQVLQRMLTVRLHLDAATRSNGALQVRAASHRVGESPTVDERMLEASAGTVLVMRPLLLHRSTSSQDPSRHRRVVHLEYSADDTPAPGFRWAPVFASRVP